MIDRLPCPFCDFNDPHIEPQTIGDMTDPLKIQVKCRMCGAMGPVGPTLDEAIGAWNNPNVRNAQKMGNVK